MASAPPTTANRCKRCCSKRCCSSLVAWTCVLVALQLAAPSHAIVPSPPTMVKQPPHEQLYQISQGADEPEKPFMLECEAQGSPEPKYRW